jgi:hypothetical protein
MDYENASFSLLYLFLSHPPLFPTRTPPPQHNLLFKLSLSLSLSLFKLSRWCNYEIENDVGNNNFEEKLSFVDSSS